MGRTRIPARDIPRNVAPRGYRCIQLMIPDDDEWEHIAFSTLYDQLALVWFNWRRTGDDTGSKLCQRWRIALRTWRHCDGTKPLFLGVDEGDDLMIRQNPDNPCLLESSVNGVDWCKFADFSLCQNFGTGPGEGKPTQPAKGGGVSKECYTLRANGILNLGIPVSTGDTISLDISGSGWDGVENDFGPLWRCPDGKQYIASFCTGFETTSGTDPVPSAFHMSTVISINGVFYSIMPGSTFTVPSGISSITPYIQVNDSALTNNEGDYQVCVTVTNNEATTWEHVFDFTVSPGGWIVPSGEGGAWIGGVGWIATIPSTQYQSFIRKIFTLPSGTAITYLEVISASAPAGTYQLYYNNPGLGPVDSGSLTTNPQTVVYSHVIPTNVISIDSVLANDASVIHKKIIIRGTGSNPF